MEPRVLHEIAPADEVGMVAAAAVADEEKE